MNWDTIRAVVPFPISEAIIGNVVVGNMTFAQALRLAQKLGQMFEKRQENTDGAGI